MVRDARVAQPPSAVFLRLLTLYALISVIRVNQW